MKINEVIVETRAKSKGKLRKGIAKAAPGLVTYDALDNNNNPYLAYRFGLALATSPNDLGDAEGPIGSDFIMIDYSDADEEIRKGAETIMGVKASTNTGRSSEELDIINKTSPTAPRKKNKYGV